MTGSGDAQLPQAVIPRKSRERQVLGTIVLAAVLVAAGVVVYVFTRPPPIPLTLADGSSTQTFQATFLDFYSNCPTARAYRATTIANQSGGPSSAISLRLYLGAYMEPGYIVDLELSAVVSGSIAPNLHPTRVAVAINQTAAPSTFTWGFPYLTALNNTFPPDPIAFGAPTNVTLNPNSGVRLGGNGSAELSTALLNTSTSGPRYEFLFPTWFSVRDPLGDNSFFGVRATLEGPFTPALSVGILVHVVNIPVPSPSVFGVTVDRPGNGSRWVLSIGPSEMYTNTSVDARIVTNDGAVVVPATALGDLYRSPYNASLGYVPTTNTGNLSVNDLVTVSATAYGLGDLLEIIQPQASGETLLYLLSLG